MKENTKTTLVAIGFVIFVFGGIILWTHVQIKSVEPHAESLKIICEKHNATWKLNGIFLTATIGVCITETEIFEYRMYNGTWRKLQ